MQYQTLLVDRFSNLMTVNFNRPSVMNPLSTQVLHELKELLSKLRYDTRTCFVIFMGDSKAFSYGIEFTIEAVGDKYMKNVP